MTSLVASGRDRCVGIGRCIRDRGESVLVGVGKLLAPACCIAVKPHAVGNNIQHDALSRGNASHCSITHERIAIMSRTSPRSTSIHSQLQHPHLPSCVPSSWRRHAATHDTCSSIVSQTPIPKPSLSSALTRHHCCPLASFWATATQPAAEGGPPGETSPSFGIFCAVRLCALAAECARRRSRQRVPAVTMREFEGRGFDAADGGAAIQTCLRDKVTKGCGM